MIISKCEFAALSSFLPIVHPFNKGKRVKIENGNTLLEIELVYVPEHYPFIKEPIVRFNIRGSNTITEYGLFKDFLFYKGININPSIEYIPGYINLPGYRSILNSNNTIIFNFPKL